MKRVSITEQSTKNKGTINLERSLVQHILMISGCPILTQYHPTIILHIGNVEARYTPPSLFEIIVLIRFLKMASLLKEEDNTVLQEFVA